jgi:hypothetical protein
METCKVGPASDKALKVVRVAVDQLGRAMPVGSPGCGFGGPPLRHPQGGAESVLSPNDYGRLVRKIFLSPGRDSGSSRGDRASVSRLLSAVRRIATNLKGGSRRL